MYTLQAFDATDEAFQLKADIWNTGYPDELTTAEMQAYYYRIRDEKFPNHISFIEHDGEIIGYGDYSQNRAMAQVKKYFVAVAVYPNHDNQQAIRQFYLDYVIAQLKDQDTDTLIMEAREDYAEDMHFFSDNGFVQVLRAPVSALDVQAFDPTPFVERADSVRDTGVEIMTVTQLQIECPDDWAQQLYELECAILADVPQPQEFVPPPFDQYLSFRINNPNFLPDGYFIARDNGVCVGLSLLKKNLADSSKIQTGLTGVLRSHRRRGIAIALKVQSVAYAKAKGIKTIMTDNEENNPMYQINMQLGFTPQPAFIAFEKSLT